MNNPNKVKISILMPIYNTPTQYIKESIESILCNSFQDFELIIADDGSDNADEITKIIDSFNDERINLFHLPHQGVSKTRNFLLDKAEEIYIAWQDSDDISMNDRLEMQYNYLEKNKNISIVGSYIEHFNDDGYIFTKKYPLKLGYLEYKCLAQPVSMWRLEDINRFNLRYNPEFPLVEDPEFFSRAFRYLNCANIPSVLLKYRVGENSLSHKDENLKIKKKYGKIIQENILRTVSADVNTQIKINQIINPLSVLENVFSVKNCCVKNKKYKVFTILGNIVIFKCKKGEND